MIDSKKIIVNTKTV